MSSDNDSLQTGVVLIILGGGLLWSSLKRKKLARKFEDAQQIKISSAPQGHVEISGFAWAEQRIPSKDGKGIAYLSWQLEQYVKRGKNSSWEVVAKGQIPNGFFINDETGSLWVDMNKADLQCKLRYEKWGSIPEFNQKAYLNMMGNIFVSGFPPSSSIFGGSFRIGVRELNLGCPVVVHGSLKSLPHSQRSKSVLSGFSSYKEKYLKFSKNSAYKMTMLDSDQNGEISEEEHRIGHVYAANTAARKTQNENTLPTETIDSLGILSHTDHDPLVVADTHEPYLVNRLRRWSSVGILGGAALLAAGACFLYMEFSGFLNTR